MTEENHFQHKIEAYDLWKSELIGAIEELHHWLNGQNLDEDGKNSLRIFETLESLKNDRLNIAFVAEFSRGKTELINSIFFADYNRRLLPSEAGRTTMCPTELFYDRKQESAYIRLLPIESRLEDTSVAEYKQDPNNWTQIPLEVDSPDQMESALREVVRTKKVSVDEAEKLGLYSKEMYSHLTEQGKEPDEIDIPVWRHALISFPHPLLKQGLVILDTPGLNALGNEPELTMSMLPAAQAILFVLAADTGVTKSDLDVWQYHIEGFRRSKQKKGIAVILNKIDTLWDELKDENTIQTSIKAQISETASALGVDKEQIFPLSAQKGLLAKIRKDDELLTRSQLPDLENYLSNEVLPGREAILRENIAAELGTLLEDQQRILTTRHENINKQLKELGTLSGKNADVIMHLMTKTREEQSTYMKNVESFQSSRRLLQRQATLMLDSLSIEELDILINKTRESMVGSWTTNGLKKGMKTFFDGVQETTELVVENAEQAHKLVLAIYKKFHIEHGLPAINPRVFSINNFTEQLEMLFHEAEAFRKNPVTAMTEQNFLIKKFFINLVSHARNTYFKTNQEAKAWLNEVMNPLIAQIKEHKHMMERRLKTLRKINESRDTLDSKISELEEDEAKLSEQLKALNLIREKMFKPVPSQVSTTQTSTAA